MKHAGAASLAVLAPLLAQLRELPGLTERQPGTFYRRSVAFLHFHEDPAGLFADARLEGPGFTRLPVDSAGEQAALLARVRAAIQPAGQGAAPSAGPGRRPGPVAPPGPGAGEAAAGYSGTPLAKKLGVSATTRLVVLDAPEAYDALLAPLPAGVVRQRSVTGTTTLVHLFVTERAVLAVRLQALRTKIDPAAAVWVSWPKKASKRPTTVTEDVIRELALPLGFVDVKVCAVSEVWSGLKLVVRKALRAAPPRG